MSDLAARAALTRLAEPGDPELVRWVNQLGATEVVGRIRDGSLDSRRLPQYRTRLTGRDLELDQFRARQLGIRLVAPGTAEWPPQLDDLAAMQPLALWARGAGNLAELCDRSVAVVGARACTGYGEHVAGTLGAGLADRGWTVVSGAAYGIDAAAHRGALAVDGPTVAVLAGGVDVVYPAGHDTLLDRIRENGLVVSELPPGSRPTKVRFLKRNRVIAALSRGTVVVEAALRSGAAHTAARAAELFRSVMAVPGAVTSATSAGCHELIRTKDASLVTDVRDVLDLVGELGVDDHPLRRGHVQSHDDLDETQLRVLEALPVSRVVGPASVARVAGLDLPSVLRCLASLSQRGQAEHVDGGWRKARGRRRGGS